MPWRKTISADATEYQNLPNKGSIWHAFKFQQNQMTVTVTSHVATLINDFMASHKISIESIQNVDNFNNMVLIVHADKKVFCGKLLEFSAAHHDDTAYELNSSVVQELKQASVTVEYMESFEARLRALELGVQYQNLPAAKDSRPILQFSFIPRLAVTENNQIAARINTLDKTGLGALHRAIIDLKGYHYNPEICINNLVDVIQQGANLELNQQGKHTLEIDDCGIGIHGGEHPLDMLNLMVRITKSIESCNMLLKVTQLLLAAGINPNYFDTNERNAQLYKIHTNNNKINRLTMTAFVTILLHYGASLPDLERLNMIQRISVTDRILSVYNNMRRQSFLESAASNSGAGAALLGLDNDLPINGYAAARDLHEIGVEKRAERRRIDHALRIQKVLRGHLSRTTKKQRDELLEARKLSLKS
jgi:hypothetical protein